jgi:peptide/nickel transport system substrate-binding protein
MRKSLLAVLGIAAAAVMTMSPAAAKSFRFGFQGDIISTDPYNANETFTTAFLLNIYEPLVRYDRKLEIEPALAESWEVVEPTRWRFKLRKGVSFHNGNPFNADDVVFTYKRATGDDSDFAGHLKPIKEVVKVDDHTVDIITRGPFPILLRVLAANAMMDHEWAKEHDAEITSNIKAGRANYAASHTNGTGPFILKSRNPDVRTELVVNSDWWDTAEHNLTEVTFTPIASDATRVSALLSGQVDMMWPVPLQDVDRINAAPNLTVLEGPAERTVFLGMDQWRDELIDSNVKGKNPFKDIRVRKAFYHAIDIDKIRDRIMRGKATPTALMLAPTTNGFDLALNDRYPYDLDLAKRLLEEAGYPDGFEVGIDCPNDRYVNDELICQAIVSMLAKIGVKVNLTAQTKSKYFQKILKQDTSFYMLGWAASATKDGYSTLSQLVASRDSGLGASYNIGGYSSSEVDALIRKIGSEVDLAKRQELFSEAFRIHKEEFGHLPLHQQALAWGTRDDIEVVQAADNILRLRYVKVK